MRRIVSYFLSCQRRRIRGMRSPVAAIVLIASVALAHQHVVAGVAAPSYRLVSLELPGRAGWVAVNNWGQAAATYSLSPQAGSGAILFGPKGATHITNRPIVGSIDLNNRGQVVGAFLDPREAFLWDKGELTSLGFLPGGTASVAQSLNERGQVVGNGNSPTGSRAILWGKGILRDLGTLPGVLGQFPFSGARSINNSAIIVGLSDHSSGFRRATLWDALWSGR